MNDFTKEELEYIKWLVEDYEGEYQSSVTELPEKLQSLIDNYCEHHWRTSAINAIYCVHCQKHVEYQE